MDQVIKLCSGQNQVDSSWFNKLDTQFSIGEMAYKNGIYNIMTRELRPLTPASLVHRKLEKNAPQHAATPGGKNWMRTKINQLFPEENARMEVMRRFAETGFTTTNKDKYVVQLYGDGDNGKSTLAAIAKAVWPQYNETVVPNSLNAGRQTSEILTWAIKFHGARWVWQDEGTCDGVLDACLIKKIRGGAALQGRVPYGPLIDVVPTWKLWLMGNDIAEIKPMDSATEKSIFTVEMIPTFTNDAADIARAKAGVHAAYVFPKDPDLLDRFKELDIQYAFTEICAEYLQMCVDSMASVGQYFPPLESEHISRDMYAEENQSPEFIFERIIDVTGDKTTRFPRTTCTRDSNPRTTRSPRRSSRTGCGSTRLNSHCAALCLCLQTQTTSRFSGVLSLGMWTWVCRGVLTWRSSELNLKYIIKYATHSTTAHTRILGCLHPHTPLHS